MGAFLDKGVDSGRGQQEVGRSEGGLEEFLLNKTPNAGIEMGR